MLIRRDIVSTLLMLKFHPWLAEREQTAFKEDDDGWMSGIVSEVVPTPSPFWCAGNSKMWDLVLLVPSRSLLSLDICVMGPSFLGTGCSRIRATD